MKTKFIQRRSRAFAFSADVMLALVLVASLFLFLSIPTQPAPKFEERRITDQFVDDLFVALDHAGFVSSQLDVNGYSTLTLQNVYDRAKSLLPSNYNVFLRLTRYPVDISSCRSGQDFASCFPDANVSFLTYGTTLTANAPYVHGRRVFLLQQPASQCSSSLFPRSPESPFSLHPTAPYSKASLQSSGLNLQFDVNISPAGPLTCDQNITISLQISGDTGSRKPVDMMLVFDRSGSMSYDVHQSATDPQGLVLDGNMVYAADSSGGLRDMNLIQAGYPSTIGTYNSPGTARDVSASGGYAFLADGASGLRIVNVTNPSTPSSVGQLDLGGDAYGVASTGNDTYVVTYDTDDTDISNQGNANNELYIGRSASQLYAGQSFQPTIDFISGVQVRVDKVGSPTGDLSVSIRSSLTGADLATGTIAASSVTTSYQYLTVTFPSVLAVTSGSTYYIVLTTTATSSSNYYEWAASSNSSYSGGQAFQNTTSQSRDARFETYYISGLIHVDTTTKASPVVLGAVDLSDPWRVWLDGSNAFVSDGSAGFKIYDITGDTPTYVGGINTAGTTYDVSVYGTTAYVSDGSSGLRLYDVSTPASPVARGTYNTPGTAYATRVHNSIAYIADSSTIQVIDVTNPNSLVFVDSYATPWTYRDIEINYPWSYLAIDNSVPGIASVHLLNGPKIDQAQVAAAAFVDFNAWDLNNDQLGLVTYSSSATTDQTLTNNFTLVKNDIGVTVANGGTATGDGINAATTELNSIRHNPDALKFQILMSDGLTNAGASSSTAAINANNNDIIIYTIGFGLDADATELANIANITGGKYYSALDQNALIDVYTLIAEEIQLIATDANVVATIPVDINVISDGNGTFSGGNLTFDINTQEPQPWEVSYTIMIPCTTTLACTSTIISFPSPGTQFQYIDVNGDPVYVDWNVFSTQTFNFRDLNIDIVSGNIVSSDNTDITVSVSSLGNLDTNATSVAFYQSDPSFGNLLTTASVPALCGAQGLGCVNNNYSFTQNVQAEGELWALVNPDQVIPECSYNDQDVIFCYENPSTQFYTMEYWAWLNV